MMKLLKPSGSYFVLRDLILARLLMQTARQQQPPTKTARMTAALA
jgi:hypothetical protein